MSKRGEMLKAFLDRNPSQSTITRCSELLKDMTVEQKEKEAGHMLTMLNNSNDEEEFLSKLKMIEQGPRQDRRTEI